jgi:hypothetical protein
MVRHATRSGRADTGMAIWFDRLREAHAALIEAIEQLAQLASGPLPDRQVLVDLRWAVSQRSLDRRLLWGEIHTLLARRVEARFEHDLRQLQAVDVELIRASAKHVGRWTVDAIAEDWEGYCRASEVMRSQMLDAIAGEKRLLYPILELVTDDKSVRCVE